jgi:hypothetical protein
MTELTIVHEPWDVSLPFALYEVYPDTPVPYFRTRAKTEEDARSWAEAYLRGPTVIASLKSEFPAAHP